MEFIWSDLGITKTYPFGYKVHGLKQNGQRPDYVIITEEEKKNSPLEESRHIEYLNRIYSQLKVKMWN